MNLDIFPGFTKLADALATLASMLPYPGNTYIDPLEIQVRDQHGYCNITAVEADGDTWYHDIKHFIKAIHCMLIEIKKELLGDLPMGSF